MILREAIKIFESTAEAKAALAENAPRLLIVYGKRICLVRHNEKIFAVQEACTHSGGALSQGKINYMGEVVCPLHGYQFNLQTGRESSERSNDLVCYPIHESEDGVFISL